MYKKKNLSLCKCSIHLYRQLTKGVWNSLQIHVPRRIVHFCNHVMELLYLNQDEVFIRMYKKTKVNLEWDFCTYRHYRGEI